MSDDDVDVVSPAGLRQLGLCKAADEIERLEAEVAGLRDVQMYDRNLIKALTADNARLTAALQEIAHARAEK